MGNTRLCKLVNTGLTVTFIMKGSRSTHLSNSMGVLAKRVPPKTLPSRGAELAKSHETHIIMQYCRSHELGYLSRCKVSCTELIALEYRI